MAYPVSRPRVRAPLSFAALNRAAGESCACDVQVDAAEAVRSEARPGRTLLLLAPWGLAIVAALIVFWY